VGIRLAPTAMRPAVDLSHSRAVVLQGGGAVHLANGTAKPGAPRAPPPSAMAGAAMARRGGGQGVARRRAVVGCRSRQPVVGHGSRRPVTDRWKKREDDASTDPCNTEGQQDHTKKGKYTKW
jgi:hypothetical protein